MSQIELISMAIALSIIALGSLCPNNCNSKRNNWMTLVQHRATIIKKNIYRNLSLMLPHMLRLMLDIQM